MTTPLRVGPDQQSDRYQLLERHASGGEGEIWRGRLQLDELEIPVAIKIAHVAAVQLGEDDGDEPVTATSGSASLKRWEQQLELLRTLDHPGLVRVREVFEGPPPHRASETAHGDRRLYLVMNWVEGRNAAQWAAEHPDRSLDEVLDILQQVSEAVDHIHLGRDTGGVPIVHRDIKPGNLVLDGPRVRLVDFGLARGAMGRTLTLAGTLAYLAPEVLEGEPFTPASDRYALGATAYHLLTDANPRLHRWEDTRAALTAGSANPADDTFAELVMRMLDPDPDRRPERCVPWVEALRRSAGHDRASSPRPSATAAPQPTTSEAPTVLRPSDLTASQASSNAETATTDPVGTARGRAVGKVGGSRSPRVWWPPLIAAAVLVLIAAAAFGWWATSAGPSAERSAERTAPWASAVLPTAGSGEAPVPLGVTSGDGYLVAVGVDRRTDNDRAAVWFSTNAQRWTPLPAEEQGFPSTSALFDVIWTGTSFVATGAAAVDKRWLPAIWNSDDATTWDRRCCDADRNRMQGVVTGVARSAADGTLVAVGRSDTQGVVWVSDDARTWSAVPPGETGIGSGSSLEAVVATDEGLVAVGGVADQAAVWRSEDGRVWEADAVAGTFPPGTTLTDVASEDSMVVAVGEQDGLATVWVLQDAGPWRRATLPRPVPGRFYGVAQVTDGMLVVGHGHRDGEPETAVAFRSTDGRSWIEVELTAAALEVDPVRGGSALAVTDSDLGPVIVGGESSGQGTLDLGVAWRAP